jgi:NAD(P)-dependent dehydrogenase (short-subunit alcohol dehydrogenase family)
MLVRTVALENKDAGLTAHVVLPGTMDTPANREAMPNADFSKWIQPRDVVNLVLSLTTERVSQVTGAVIPIGNHNV